MPALSTFQWLLLFVAAFGIGITKSGFAGVSMVHVLIFAHVFGARESTGVVLPMLIAGDLFAMRTYGKHANWSYVRRMLGPALIGVCAGWLLMQFFRDDRFYRRIIGTIILSLTVLQIVRMTEPKWLADVPHSRWFAWSMGILVGLTTMLANAAGPIFGLYMLSIRLPKMEFVGTAAWFFLLLNCSKVPFSLNLGLIEYRTLTINLLLLPMILVGLWVGRWILHRIPQKAFDTTILIITAIATVRLLFL